MKDDTISRKAAIEAINEDKIDLTNPNVVAVFKATGDFEKVETQVMTCDRHIKILKDLPPTQPKQQWIPCNVRLPRVADCYAVTRQIGSDLIVSACYFDGINNWHNDNWINHERNYLTDIVAWCPLPEPYKEEEQDG